MLQVSELHQGGHRLRVYLLRREKVHLLQLMKLMSKGSLVVRVVVRMRAQGSLRKQRAQGAAKLLLVLLIWILQGLNQILVRTLGSKERIAERSARNRTSNNRIINIILIGKVDRVLSMLIAHLIIVIVIVANISRGLLLFYQALSVALRVVHLVFIMILIQMSQRCRILMSALSFVVVICSSSFIWHHEWLSLSLDQLILPRTKICLSIWCLFCVEEPILLRHSRILLLG